MRVYKLKRKFQKKNQEESDLTNIQQTISQIKKYLNR